MKDQTKDKALTGELSRVTDEDFLGLQTDGPSTTGEIVPAPGMDAFVK